MARAVAAGACNVMCGVPEDVVVVVVEEKRILKQQQLYNEHITKGFPEPTATMVRISTTVLGCAAALSAMALPGVALSPPMIVPDYISEMPSLPHCNEVERNIGGFSVSRVRCGCNDDEVKLGNFLGQVRLGGIWKVSKFSAFCKSEGEESCMCTRGPLPPLCEQNEMPAECDCCGCSCQMRPLPQLPPSVFRRI